MKARYYFLILLLLCISQALHAQDKPIEPIKPYERLNAGASVTKTLAYHKAGENTGNYYRFSTSEPLLFTFGCSNFSYNQGWNDPLPQTNLYLNCTIAEDEFTPAKHLYAFTVDGRTGQFLAPSSTKPLKLPAGNYQFTFADVIGELRPIGTKVAAAAPLDVVVPPATYFFDLHITTETPPAPVIPDPDPDDEALPSIPSAGINPLIDLPATDRVNSVCTFSSRDGSMAKGDLLVNYADDLGRSAETARKGHTAQGSNLVSLQEYDAWGRKANVWLEAAANTEAGAYLTPEQCKTLASQTNNGDSRPYTETIYEASPLNRPIKQYGPGQDWNAKGKAMNTAYLSNGTDAGELRCLKFTATKKSSTEMTVTSAGYYAAGSLQVAKTSDEDGKTQLEFTDRSGKVVLSRQTELKGSTQVFYDTYYIFDGAGNLQAVLPPELSAKAAASGSLAKAELDKYAYLYFYDTMHRLSERKLPGADWERFRYDDADHLIFRQDGNLSKEGKWEFSIPDKFGRVCLKGVCTGYIFKIDLNKTNLNNFAFCEYIGKKGEHHGYTISGVSITSPVFHKVDYYDNYRFLTDDMLPISVPKDSFVYVSRAGYGEKHVSAKGSRTGALTAQAGTANGCLGSAYYYDARARLIQSHTANHLNGVETECIAYNFSGQPVKRLHIHSASGKPTQTETYTYTYSDSGLPLTVKHRLGNGAETTLSDKVYDALGRLSQDKRNGNANLLTGYAYNVRSWLTGISGNRFAQNLYYNADGANANKCYNGNISSMTWKAGDATMHGYKFSYDAVNRMTSAAYGQGAAINTCLDRFSELVTGYDKNGNILGLKRYGQTGAGTYNLIDNLTMTLNGNQLNRVEDAVTAPAYNGGFEFKNGASAAGEYAYDANGNLIKDLNKSITNIEYNFLNLPGKVTFSDGSTISYLYSADGKKLRTVHKIGSTTTTTDYCDNVVYENGTPKLLLTEEGYVSLKDKKYHYYLKDHQGNNRVVTNQSGSVEETNHYYPFGGIFASTGNVQAYKYNGKELDAKKGLNWYDYGARHYDAALGRWHVIDPMAEKYYGISPYTYCNNSPVKHIDPDGRWFWTAFGVGLEYGSQVYKNYKSGKSGYDAWVGDVNFAKVGLSTINPAGKLKVIKTLAVEGLKEAFKAIPNEGIGVETNVEDIATNVVINTSVSVVASKITKSSSDKALESANKEMRAANKKVKTAKNRVNKHPASKSKQSQLNNAEMNVKQARAKQVGSQMLNSTIGQINPNAVEQIITNGFSSLDLNIDWNEKK